MNPYSKSFEIGDQPPRRRCNCVIWCSVIVIIICAIVITVALTLRFAFRRHAPNIQVDFFNVSSFDVSSDGRYDGPANTRPLSGNWAVQLSLRNPNKYWSISYTEMWIVVRCHKTELTPELTVPFFEMDTKDDKVISSNLTAVRDIFKWDAQIIKAEWATGYVNFNVKIIANVEFEFRKRTKKRHVEGHCEDLKVPLPSSSNQGTMEGGKPKECEVDVS